MRNILKDKNGSSFTGWITGIAFMVLFVSIFSGVVISNMNDIHGGNNTVNLGTDSLEESFDAFQNSSTKRLKDGELSITDLGAFLFVDSWKVLMGAFDFVLQFLFGTWIKTIFSDFLQLPDSVAVTIQGIWIISLIFIIISLVFKRNT